MPSFGVNNHRPYSSNDTYRRYLPIAMHFSRRGSQDLNHQTMQQTCKANCIFMLLFVLLCCICMIWSFVFEYFLFNAPSTYNNYYLYYFNYSCIITARLSFLLLWTRIFPILSTAKSAAQKCKKFSIAMSIILTSISIGIYLTNLWYHRLAEDNDDNDLTLISNKKQHSSLSSSFLCNHVIECQLTDPLSFYCLFIQFTLILLILVTFCVHKRQFGSFREHKQRPSSQSYSVDAKGQIKRKKKRSKKRGKSRKKAAIALLETHEDDLVEHDSNEHKSVDDEHDEQSSPSMLTPQPQPAPAMNNQENITYLMLHDDDEHEHHEQGLVMDESPNSFKATKLKMLLFQSGCFAILFVLWCIHYFFGILQEEFIQRHILKIYMLFVLVMAICKATLKSFARKLDGLRMGSVTVSFEYVCEFYCCAMYWILFRQLIVYHVVFKDDGAVTTFVCMLCVHLTMELYGFLFRASDWYFDKVNDFLHELGQRQDRFYEWIYNACNDDSNVYQWRARLAFDLMVRINVCLVTAVIQQIYLLLMIPSIYSTVYTDFVNVFQHGFNDEMFIKASVYNASSVLAEIVLYMIVMCLVKKWYCMNVWQLFDNMINGAMGIWTVLLCWVICVVSIY